MTEKFVFEPQNIENIGTEYDIAVVGSGASGLIAALQAFELGKKVVVLEKMKNLGGNTSRASSGMNAAESNVQLQHKIVDNIENFYEETYHGGGKLNDPNLLHYFTTHSALAIDWLRYHGIKLDDITITGGMSVKRTHRPSSMAPIGAFLIKSLLKLIDKAQIDVFNNAKVTRILFDKKVTGLEINGETRIKADAVILATGGFGASKEKILKYRPDLINYKTTNQPGTTGDGLKLAQDLGAQLVQLDMVQVHPTVQQDQEHTYLIGEAVRGEGAILVDSYGNRFVNELSTRKNVSNAITALPNKSAYLIFDEQVRRRVKAIEFYYHIGLVESAPTILELAEKIGAKKENLEATIIQWNKSIQNKKDSIYGRNTGMKNKLNEPKFYAIHIAPAIHYTMGGIHIDDRTQVLDEDGNPILGLYASGEVTGGLHGNNRIGGNSIAETVVFGLRAGQQTSLFVTKL